MTGQNPVRVVIIDDNDDLRLLLSMLIEADDRFELLAQAPDGLRGLELLKRITPDLVVLDVAMPDIDGLQMLDECNGRWPLLPILSVLSSFNEAIMGPIAIEHGAAAYIEKDVRMGKTVLDRLWSVWCEHGLPKLEQAR